MGPEHNVGLEGCWIMECLLPYLCMVTVFNVMIGLERMLDYRGVGLTRFHCNTCKTPRVFAIGWEIQISAAPERILRVIN